MHRALESEDIIYSVLEHVKSSAMDLVNVAMTCSTLAGPALNILWSTQSSLAPLIMCLPQDTWEVAENQTIDLSREPTPIEWERLRMNASRVRRIHINGISSALPPKPHLTLSGRALQRIFEQFPPAILFPNLHALDFEAICNLPGCSSKFLLLRQFMSPNLECLSFDVPGGVQTYEVEQLLGAFPAEAYGLRELIIRTNHCATTFTVPPSFGKLPKLIRLAIEGIDVGLTRQTITNIQPQAQCLQSLTLTLRGTSCDVGGMPFEFHGLWHLCLFGDSLSQSTHFLRQITARQLAYISIGYSEPASPAKITEFMESLSTLCQNFGSLQQIYMIDTSHIQKFEDTIPLPSEVFRPLLKFRRLSSVILVGIGNYNLDDKFINDVAVAWPDIQALRFASRRRASCTVTFSAMMSMASRCRSLHTLHLTLDATRPTTTPRAPDGTEELWPSQTALQKLHLGHTEVLEVSRVPYLLAEVFPTLSDFLWYESFVDSDTDLTMEDALEEAWQQLRVLRNLADDDHDDYDWEWEGISDSEDWM
ncbi:uncharacterized protein BJ212DRAFT_1304691 [Suillus subaureus]|uniref:F-box domain-containing protein n=1 Tax=Suillus subaureus TaxID=48587 RepID=A0A9P7DU01_9AGAM|nr:uncharacterized protein BJ212DRAFT_1304691 [Suillus subaureus]KAG1803129.1 hypothetical protein BJ212DRAFT_1304691 [Suillus subaureus]